MITHGTMDTFQGRLQRISAGKTTVWTDPGGGLASVQGQRTFLAHQKKSSTKNAVSMFGFVQAAILGVLAVIVSRFVRFHQLDLTEAGTSGELLYTVDIGMGLALGFVLCLLFGFKGVKVKMVQALAIFAAVGLMHNLVWQFPDQARLGFGADYVQGVMNVTKPNSFLFRGESLTF